jgi:hypothetical protein
LSSGILSGTVYDIPWSLPSKKHRSFFASVQQLLPLREAVADTFLYYSWRSSLPLHNILSFAGKR